MVNFKPCALSIATASMVGFVGTEWLSNQADKQFLQQEAATAARRAPPTDGAKIAVELKEAGRIQS